MTGFTKRTLINLSDFEAQYFYGLGQEHVH